jgi:putative hydrolase of HD superfamily
MSKNTKALINFLAEIGQLKRVKRSGWWVAGIKYPESVAEHCLRTAIIGYIIARMEKVEPYQVILTILFHDTHEARTNDLHKISLNYFDFRSAEKKIIKEQLNALHATLRQEISALLKEYHAQKSKQSIIARDADILECILQAKEYLGQGYTQAKNFLSVGKKHLKTKSAQQLFKSILTWNYQDWWLHLAKFSR